jgi:hypothetical protein
VITRGITPIHKLADRKSKSCGQLTFSKFLMQAASVRNRFCHSTREIVDIFMARPSALWQHLVLEWDDNHSAEFCLEPHYQKTLGRNVWKKNVAIMAIMFYIWQSRIGSIVPFLRKCKNVTKMKDSA